MLPADGWKPEAWHVASLVKFHPDRWTDSEKIVLANPTTNGRYVANLGKFRPEV